MDFLLILLAAFGAGVVNTIAGGGTFLTFPALVFIGVPPVIANATSAVAVLPGYAAGAMGFRAELTRFDRAQLVRLSALTVVGGIIGAALLLVSSNAAFGMVVPFLLLGATLAFLFGDRLREWAARNSRGVPPYGAVGLIAVAVYGGYFNGGLGIVLLALFSLWGMQDIHQMNGLKNGLSFVLSVISVAVFAIGGLVEWHLAVGMMVASTIGGYAGAPVARAMPRAVVRGVIAVIGFSMSVVFFWRLLG
jgi:uncharacterized membrane protein YfcA